MCMSVLLGEKTDGSGTMCIHLFVRDERGPITEPAALHPVIGEDGQQVPQKVAAKPTRGRLACDPKRMVAPVTKNNVTYVTLRTDAFDAVTCPKCKRSPEYLVWASAGLATPTEKTTNPTMG